MTPLSERKCPSQVALFNSLKNAKLKNSRQEQWFPKVWVATQKTVAKGQKMGCVDAMQTWVSKVKIDRVLYFQQSFYGEG